MLQNIIFFFFVAITVFLAIGASLVPFFLDQKIEFVTVADFYDYTEFVGSVATTLALVWVVVNSIMQRRQINMQQNELSLHRNVLTKTSEATFSQFYILYFDEFERALDRIANKILEILEIDTKNANERRRNGERDAHIRTLAKLDNLQTEIQNKIQTGSGDILQEVLKHYLRVYKQLSLMAEIGVVQSDSKDGNGILEVFEAANPAAQLLQTFKHISEQQSSNPSD